MLSRSTLSEKGEGKEGGRGERRGRGVGVKEDEGEREFSASSLLVNTGCFSWLAVSLPNQEKPYNHLTGVNKYRLHLLLRGAVYLCTLAV